MPSNKKQLMHANIKHPSMLFVGMKTSKMINPTTQVNPKQKTTAKTIEANPESLNDLSVSNLTKLAAIITIRSISIDIPIFSIATLLALLRSFVYSIDNEHIKSAYTLFTKVSHFLQIYRKVLFYAVFFAYI
jgi:hypothetical protein